MLSKEEIEFCSSLEKMFNYLKTKKELTEFEQQVIINFDYITKKVLSDECKTATEIVAKNMYYELVKRKEEYYKKQIKQLESDKQKLIEKLEERIRYFEENDELLATTYDNYSDGTVTKRIIDELRRLLLIVKGVENERDKI